MFSSSVSAPSSFLNSSSRFCSYLSQAAWLSEEEKKDIQIYELGV